MGAANALAVYRTYGDVLGDRALRVLTYMALVARDQDAEPWFSMGHEEISRFALGRPVPAAEGHERDAALRAVRRAVTELHGAGAIQTARRATYGVRGNSPVRYRLYLDAPRPDTSPPDGKRPMDNPVENTSPPDGFRPMDGEAIGRNLVAHRTIRGRPQDEIRPPKEEEEEEEREKTPVDPLSPRDVEDTPPDDREPSGRHRKRTPLARSA